MEYVIHRDFPVIPPVKNVVITLTPEELHSLRISMEKCSNLAYKLYDTLKRIDIECGNKEYL